MSRRRKSAETAKSQTEDSVRAPEDDVDPVLATLFASSSGPVTASVRSKAAGSSSRDATRVAKQLNHKMIQKEDTETTSESEAKPSEDEEKEAEERPRKRRRLSLDDDIEGAYLDRLAKEEEKEMSQRSTDKHEAKDLQDSDEEDDHETASSASNDLDDLSDLEADDAIPQHESLSKPAADHEKIRRTVFLSNVSTEAIRSKTSRKELEAHLKSVLEVDAKETIESLRFRSTAFNVDAGPKRAAYAKKELMDETTKSTNAYVIFNTEVAARKVARKLNGTIVLDRHLHTDWLAHPTAIDHKRCVFVGNLNFVDLESNIETDQDGEKQKRRPKARVPADAEEGLWRTFSKCGTVESVRVVRDKATRVGKGFAYVQFSDDIGVEKALALDGKKFPPMLPRLLRVSRAKKILKKDLKRKREDSGTKGLKGREDNRRAGRPVANRQRLNGVVFEGYRASADKGMKFKTKGKKKGGVKPTSRSSKRGAAFKAGGGKKKRNM